MKNLGFIPNIESYSQIIKIVEGSSGDDKYKIEKDGRYLLLRVGDKSRADIRFEEFNRLKLLEEKNINTHSPVDFGIINDKFYSIVSWVDGTTVMNIIKENVKQDHYDLGKNIGNELKKLHDASLADSKIDWHSEIQRKTALFLDYYHKMKIEFTGSKRAEKYVLNHLDLIIDKPQVILHGDFHWNNCVVNDNNQVGIIDFSGVNIGDPWYEFGGILWALEYSESFTNGQIDGYFGIPPTEFWGVFKLYVALYAFEHLTYSDGSSNDIKNKISNASRMLKIFGENFQENIPLFRRI